MVRWRLLVISYANSSARSRRRLGRGRSAAGTRGATHPFWLIMVDPDAGWGSAIVCGHETDGDCFDLAEPSLVAMQDRRPAETTDRAAQRRQPGRRRRAALT